MKICTLLIVGQPQTMNEVRAWLSLYVSAT